MAGEAMIGIVLLPLLLQASPATQRSPDVVVTARAKPSAEVIRQRVRAITRRSGDQVARFNEPVCAGTIGLPEPYAGRVITRIMADARAAGVPTDKAGCRPNVTLVIVDDGRQLLAELKRRRAPLFRAVPPGDIDRALAEPGPVRSITATQLLSRDGDAPSGDYTSGNGGIGGGAPTLLVRSASILDLPTRQDIAGSLVMIDTAATLGKTLTQLADYTAMRALAKTNTVARADDNTILALFNNSAPAPRRLTPFDAAFLKALYRGPPTAKFNVQIARMSRQIAESAE